MLDHTGIGVANVARSAAFYDATLGALGLRWAMQLPEYYVQLSPDTHPVDSVCRE